jgi:hypothetical protein
VLVKQWIQTALVLNRKFDNKQQERFNVSEFLTKKIPAQFCGEISLHFVYPIWLVALDCCGKIQIIFLLTNIPFFLSASR